MKHDALHIILIPLLAIIMAACSDTPLPAPTTATDKAAAVVFSLNLNSSSPNSSRALSRAETTEIRTAWDSATDEAISPAWWNAVAADRFDGITAGTLTITYSSADNTSKRLAITTDGFNLYDANTPAGAGDLPIELTAEQAAAIATSSLSIGSYNVTITKITYSVTTGSADPKPTQTEEYILTEDERVFPSDYDGAYANRYVFDKGIFTQNEPVVGGFITVTVKDAQNQNNDVEFRIDNTWKKGITPTQDGDIYIHKYQIDEAASTSIKNNGLEVIAYNRTITKITYTATIGSGSTGGDDPKPEVPSDTEIKTIEFDPAITLENWATKTITPDMLPDITTGALTITVTFTEGKLQYLELKIDDNKFASTDTPGTWNVGTLKEEQVNVIKEKGFVLTADGATVTKITYTAKKKVEPGPAPGLLWKDEYNPGDEDAADCVIDPDKLHLLIYDSDSEALIAWVKGVRLTDQSGNDRHYGGELSISLDKFKTATGGTRTADGTSTSNAAGIIESVNEVTVIALANWNRAAVASLLTTGSTIADLEAKAAAFDWNAAFGAKENGYIPMWGQSRIHVDFSAGNLANLLDIKLLRSLAKVKITLSDKAANPAASTAPYYDIASVKVNNYVAKGYYMPSGIRMTTEIEGAATPLKVATTELSVADCCNFFSTDALQSTPNINLPGGVKSYILYLPEQLNNADVATRPTIDIAIKSLDPGNEIPVGETLKGTLHFTRTGLADDEPKNIVRNHQYDFTIKIDGGLKFSVTVADMIDGGTYSYEYVIQ